MDVCEDVDADIYEGLPDFRYDKTLDELNATIRKLETENNELQCKLIQMIKDKNILEADCKVLNTNISSLLKTAKQEIRRKDRAIDDLRRELNTTVHPSRRFGVKRRCHSSSDRKMNTPSKRPRIERESGGKTSETGGQKPRAFDKDFKCSSPSGNDRNLPIPKHNVVKQLNSKPSPSATPLNERDLNAAVKQEKKNIPREDARSEHANSVVQASTKPPLPPPMNCPTLFSARMYKRMYNKNDFKTTEASSVPSQITNVDETSERFSMVKESVETIEQPVPSFALLKEDANVAENKLENVDANNPERHQMALQNLAKEIAVSTPEESVPSHPKSSSTLTNSSLGQCSVSELNKVTAKSVDRTSSNVLPSANCDVDQVNKRSSDLSKVQTDNNLVNQTTTSFVEPSLSQIVTGDTTQVTKPACPLSLPDLNKKSLDGNKCALGDGLLAVCTSTKPAQSVPVRPTSVHTYGTVAIKSTNLATDLLVSSGSSEKVQTVPVRSGPTLDACSFNTSKQVLTPKEFVNNCSLKLPSSAVKVKVNTKKMFAPISNQWHCLKPPPCAPVQTLGNPEHEQPTKIVNRSEDDDFSKVTSVTSALSVKIDETRKILLDVFGSPLKWAEDGSSDSVKMDVPLSINPRNKMLYSIFGSPSKNGDSCSSESPANFNLPPGAYEDSCCTNQTDKASLLNKSSLYIPPDLSNNRVIAKDKSSESESRSVDPCDKTISDTFPPPSRPIGKKNHSMFSPVKDSKSSLHAINFEDRSSTGLFFPFKTGNSYEDSVLGHFDDTAQFVSALAKVDTKLSPLNTPIKATEIDDDSKTCPIQNPTSFKEVFQNKNLQGETMSAVNSETFATNTKVSDFSSEEMQNHKPENISRSEKNLELTSNCLLNEEEMTTHDLQLSDSSSNPFVATKFIHRSNFSSSSLFTANRNSQSNFTDKPVNILQPRKTPRKVGTQTLSVPPRGREIQLNSKIAINDAFITEQEERVRRWESDNLYENTTISSCASPRNSSPCKSLVKTPSPRRCTGNSRNSNKLHRKIPSPGKTQAKTSSPRKGQLKTTSPSKGQAKTPVNTRKSSSNKLTPNRIAKKPMGIDEITKHASELEEPAKNEVTPQGVTPDEKISASLDITAKGVDQNVSNLSPEAVNSPDRSTELPSEISFPCKNVDSKPFKGAKIQEQSTAPAITEAEFQEIIVDEKIAGSIDLSVKALKMVLSAAKQSVPSKTVNLTALSTGQAEPVKTGIGSHEVTVDQKIEGNTEEQSVFKPTLEKRNSTGYNADISTSSIPSSNVTNKKPSMEKMIPEKRIHNTPKFTPEPGGLRTNPTADGKITDSRNINAKALNMVLSVISPIVSTGKTFNPPKLSVKLPVSVCSGSTAFSSKSIESNGVLAKSVHQNSSITGVSQILIKTPFRKSRDFKKSSSLKTDSNKTQRNKFLTQNQRTNQNTSVETLPIRPESNETGIPTATVPVFVRRKSASNFQASTFEKEFRIKSSLTTRSSILESTRSKNKIETDYAPPAKWNVHPIDLNVPKDIYCSLNTSSSAYDPRGHTKSTKQQDDSSCANKVELGDKKTNDSAIVECVKSYPESPSVAGFNPNISAINSVLESGIRRNTVNPELVTSTPFPSKANGMVVQKKRIDAQPRVVSVEKTDVACYSKSITTRSGKTSKLTAKLIAALPKQTHRKGRKKCDVLHVEYSPPQENPEEVEVPTVEKRYKSTLKSKSLESSIVSDSSIVSSNAISKSTSNLQGEVSVSSMVPVLGKSGSRMDEQTSSSLPPKVIKLNRRNVNFGCVSVVHSTKIIVPGRRQATFSASR